MTNTRNANGINAISANTNTNAKESKRTALLIAAAILFVIAVVWRVIISANSFTNRIVKQLSEHGCVIDAGALYQERFVRNTSIAELMEDVDMANAVAASLECDFPSDTDLVGDVYLLLANMGDDEHVLTIFVVGEKVELAFIQTLGSDELLPVNHDFAS
ncbi:MAG: hypothetical protein J1E60_01355 [Christensenellaceae bacterium]|nr:hypothetical protein [Christensenellaceae bacterium]